MAVARDDDGFREGDFLLLDAPSEPVGIHSWTKPVITELPIYANTYVIVFTDGVLYAGRSSGQRLDVLRLIRDLFDVPAEEQVSVQVLADGILARAIACDRGRPGDDISVATIAVLPVASEADGVRRMFVRFPIWVKKVVQGG